MTGELCPVCRLPLERAPLATGRVRLVLALEFPDRPPIHFALEGTASKAGLTIALASLATAARKEVP